MFEDKDEEQMMRPFNFLPFCCLEPGILLERYYSTPPSLGEGKKA